MTTNKPGRPLIGSLGVVEVMDERQSLEDVFEAY